MISRARPQPASDRPLARAVAVVLAGLAVGIPRGAAAEPEADAARSEALFLEAKTLIDARSYGEACPKLEESQRLDPGGGTLLMLAVCHESQGRTASAWVEFRQAMGQAVADGRKDREAIARERSAALEPKLSRLTVRVAPGVAGFTGLSILLDGTPLARSSWDVPVPVDPGEHRVEARAPDKRPFEASITVGADADDRSIDVARLDDVTRPPAAHAPSPPRPAPAPQGSARRTVGWIVGGVGLAGLGLGTASGIAAFSWQGTADDECPRDTECHKQHAVDLNARAKTAADLSTVAFVVGVVGVGVGVYLLLSGRAPSSDKPARSARVDQRALFAPSWP